NVVDDTSGVARLHLMQNHKRLSGNADIDHRFLAAGAEATDRGEIKVHAAALDRFDESVIEPFRPIPAAARSHPDRYPRNRWQEFVHARLADLAEHSDVFNLRHHSLSRSSARTSRCSVRSFTCPQMRWLTSTTGASAH